jgi:hypothetical protein
LRFVECTLRDLCASGAAVRLAASTPGSFELRIARDGSTQWRGRSAKTAIAAALPSLLLSAGK